MLADEPMDEDSEVGPVRRRSSLIELSGALKQSVSSVNDELYKLMHEGDRNDFWRHHSDELEKNGCTDIFSQNDSLLANDSGFSDVAHMLYPYKYFAACLAILSFASNIYTILTEDFSVLFQQSTTGSEDEFLLTKSIIARLSEEDKVPKVFICSLVPALELFFLTLYALRLLWCFSIAAFYPCCYLRRGWRSDATREEQLHAQFVRWHNIAEGFWQHFPWVATFSAMKMLYSVTPIVMATEAYNVGFSAKEKFDKASDYTSDENKGLSCLQRFCMRCRGAAELLWYIASRLLWLIIGFDAFLVKFRMVEKYVDEHSASFYAVLYCTVFLFQVLSIININRFVRDRLFVFIFAGEDGTLSLTEEARKDVWCALLARQVWTEFTVLNYLVVMLSFDDYDYQFLVLDPRKKVVASKKDQTYEDLKPVCTTDSRDVERGDVNEREWRSKSKNATAD